MIINADSLLPHLMEKVRPTKSDDSRHLICPECSVRTKLNVLGDGRRKCTVCGKKFRIHKVTEGNKLRQCAEILLCFCIDFPAQRTASITQHRPRLVAAYYDHFRALLAEKSLPPEKMESLSTYVEILEVPREKSWCVWCKSKRRTAEAGGGTPVFGVEFRNNGSVVLDPLQGDAAQRCFQRILSREEAPGSREGYAGFVCCGTFHRFPETPKAKENAEQLWTWIRERIRSHHSLWKKNAHYLKELEWRYNSRALDLDLQAKNFIAMIPEHFLTSWSSKTKD